MRQHANAQEDHAIELTPPVCANAPWRVLDLEVLTGYRLRVRFNDGTAGIVDLAGLLNSEDAGVFVSLRNEHVFRQARALRHSAAMWRRVSCFRPMNCRLLASGSAPTSKRRRGGLENLPRRGI